MATRLNLKAPASGKHHHNYNPVTITSLDFSEIVPTRVIETTLSDSFNSIKAGGVLRMVPQTFPPYGKLFIKNASFFVPESQLLMYSDALHNKQLYYQGKKVVEPGFYMINVIQKILSNSSGVNGQFWCTVVDSNLDPTQSGFVDPDPDTFDFMYPVLDGTTVKFNTYRCGYLGDRVLKILKLLGYDIPSYKIVTGNIGETKLSGTNWVSALPFLAYLKIYCDMFLSGTFYNNNSIVALLRSIKDGEDFVLSGNNIYTYNTGIILGDYIPTLVLSCLTPHSSNMYTTAWNSLNSPDGINPSTRMSSLNPSGLLSPSMPDFTGGADGIVTSSDVTTLRNSAGADISSLPQQNLFILHSVFQFIQRNNLAGTKPAQDLFARFGIKSEDFKTNFVHKLSEGSQRIDFNAVMNNAGTPGSTLGDYAGFGASGVGVDYSYQSSSFGYLITLHWLQIEPIITRGCSPSVLRKDGFDFYTPEFDGKASRAIPYMEISSNKKVSATVSGPRDTDVYGFIPIYQDYREMRDAVAGSFLTGKARRYFFGRDFSVMRNSSFKPQSFEVQMYSSDDNHDISNPFNSVPSAGDRFFLFLDWDISAERPMLNDEDTYQLDGKGDTVISKNGKMLS